MDCILNLIRKSVFIFGFTMLVLFISPMAIGIINIGNITGAFMSVVLILVCKYFRNLKFILKQMYSDKFKRIILIAILVILIFSTVCVILLSIMMTLVAINSPVQNSTVVVLGCKVNGDIPSTMLARRLEAATQYLNENPNTVCIVSGGKGNGENISEADAMYKYLLNAGIDESRIYIENQSSNTSENMEFSKIIIEKYNFNTDIAIVTDGFHQLRASIISKDNGLNPYSIAAKTPWYVFPTYYIRELFALVEQIFLK